MNRHLELFLVHNLLEPGLVRRLRRVHIDTHDERAGELGFDAVYLPVRKAHLQAEIVQVQLVVHVLGPDGDHLYAVDSRRVRSVDPELGRSEHALLNLLLRGHSRVISDDYPVMRHECLHTVHPRNLLQPCLEGHRAAVAFHGAEIFHLHRLEGGRVNELVHSAILQCLLYTPGNIDGRELDLVAEIYSKCDENDGKQCRKKPQEHIGLVFRTDPDAERLSRTGGHAFPAEGAVHVPQRTALCPVHINAERTGLVAMIAMDTIKIVLHDMEHLQRRLSAENLEKVSCQAECGKQNPPWNPGSQHVQKPPEGKENNYPHPELEGVRDGSERAEILAPEILHKESEQQYRSHGNN